MRRLFFGSVGGKHIIAEMTIVVAFNVSGKGYDSSLNNSGQLTPNTFSYRGNQIRISAFYSTVITSPMTYIYISSDTPLNANKILLDIDGTQYEFTRNTASTKEHYDLATRIFRTENATHKIKILSIS